MTDTNLRILTHPRDEPHFAISYHRRDWSKAIHAVCRWKEQGLISAYDMDYLARQILTRASLDGELRKASQPRPWTFTERLCCLVRDVSLSIAREALWLCGAIK
jgi:hypothetical protein